MRLKIISVYSIFFVFFSYTHLWMPFFNGGYVLAQNPEVDELSLTGATVYEYEDTTQPVAIQESEQTNTETEDFEGESILEDEVQDEVQNELAIDTESSVKNDLGLIADNEITNTNTTDTLLQDNHPEELLIASGSLNGSGEINSRLQQELTNDLENENMKGEGGGEKEENTLPLPEKNSLNTGNNTVDTGEDTLITTQLITIYDDTNEIVQERKETTTILKKGTITVTLPMNLHINTAQGQVRTFEQLTILPIKEESLLIEKTTISYGYTDAIDEKIVIQEQTPNEEIVYIETIYEDEKIETPSVETTPVEIPTAETSPTETTPTETSPVETTPVETSPVETSPVETSPVETSPVENNGEEPGPTRKSARKNVFEFGIPGEHLIFSEAVLIEYAVPFPEGAKVAVSVQHAGESQPGTVGLSTMSSTSCSPNGESTAGGNIAKVVGGKIQFLTCGASIFTVTYTGGANFDNFVDASSTGKIISITSGNIAPGSTIQDVNVIVDFWKIDGENPATPGAGQAYSDEISFVLQSPLGTIVNLLTAGTYTNTANANRVTVTFDDSAGSPPTNLPVTGTFLPTDNLSGFKREDPIGDRIFTFGDSVAQDGLILYSVSLEIDAQELCGNGVLNIGEGCDDGNNTNGDGCSLACNVENGYACNSASPGLTGAASCNSGICDESESPATCEAANSCGNNKLEFGEDCDDGNTTNFDGCSATCTIEFCGNGIIDNAPSNQTLFLEDFESIGNGTVTSNTTIVSTTGYTLFFETSPTGRARYGNQSVQSNGGAGAITLDVNPSGTFVQNYLIFQVDLSAAASATDLALSFDFSHHGEESHITDRVWIRGSDTDLWIEIYNRDANKGGAGTFTSVTNLDIDATLYANSQYPSSTFQIRFGQEDNFPATSTTASDGLSIDNVQITGTPSGPISNETCDDGNTNNSDGCNLSCQVEAGRECTGEPSVCTLIPGPTGLRLHYDGSLSGGLFTDISGNGFDGSQFNGVTTGNQNGETIMCFNGTNQYIERASNLATAYPFTMSTWVKSDTISGLHGIMSFARSTAGNRMYNIEHNGTVLRARAQNTTARYANATPLLNTSDWFLLTSVFNGNSSRDIYVNGILVGSNTQAATYDTNTTKRLNIGRLADSSPSNYFDGCMDDIRFYSSELTSGQVYSLYAQPAALTTSSTSSSSPLLTGTMQGVLDTITLTISGNVYTGTNNGDGTRTLNAGVISPGLANGTYPTILTVTNPYDRSVTYESSFIVDIPTNSGDYCIAAPSSISFPQITTEGYAQTGFTSSSGYFEIIDSSGADSGYYTTLQITDLSGTTTTIPNSDLAWQSTGITLLSGTANAGVVLGSAFSSYSIATGTVTFIKRDPAANSGIIGTYGAILDVRISLPPYIKPDTYAGTMTYTLYEN